MYHCSTMPMSAHIAAGMPGAVVIEPDGLPAVDRSYVLVQSEVHVAVTAATRSREVDAGGAAAVTPDAVVFNGVANQYDTARSRRRSGERVRFWVLDAGPNRVTSFHIVGGQFDTVWSEGAYRLRPGAAGSGEDPAGVRPSGCRPRRADSSSSRSPSPDTTPSSTTSWRAPRRAPTASCSSRTDDRGRGGDPARPTLGVCRVPRSPRTSSEAVAR